MSEFNTTTPVVLAGTSRYNISPRKQHKNQVSINKYEIYKAADNHHAGPTHDLKPTQIKFTL